MAKGQPIRPLATDESNLRNRRKNEIFWQAGDGPKDRRAGYEYRPDEVICIPCAICSKAITMKPRLYPNYLRRHDGTVAWLCHSCAGRYERGTGYNYQAER